MNKHMELLSIPSYILINFWVKFVSWSKPTRQCLK